MSSANSAMWPGNATLPPHHADSYCQTAADLMARPGVRAATGSADWPPPSRVGGCHGRRQFARRHGRALGADRRLRAARDRAQTDLWLRADRLVLHAFECRQRAAPAGPQMTRPGGVLAACMGTLPVARNCV